MPLGPYPNRWPPDPWQWFWGPSWQARRGQESGWLEQVVNLLCSEFIDIQILEYSPSWSQSPPRIR